MSFSALGLVPTLVRAAASQGLLTPTPIQSQAIPLLVEGQDVLVCAPTGSGKTATYVLPLLQAWIHSISSQTEGHSRTTHTLILVPTRELAKQVAAFIKQLSHAIGTAPKVAVLTGGVSINPQLMALRGGVDWVIATPGRLLDVIAHSKLNLMTIENLVMDEADRLMDLGFAQEVDRIMALLPATTQRRTLMLSATFAPALQALIPALMHESYQHIEIESTHQQDATIVQRAIYVNTDQRTSVLREIIEQHPNQRILVFVASRYSTEHIANKLYAKRISVTPLHGDLSQGARQSALDSFKANHCQVLVATDLAARGIHIDALPVVVNYDLPRSSDDYIHRIGRTGRAGACGLAISLVSPSTKAHWNLIAKRNRLDITLETLPAYPVTELVPTRSPYEDGNNGGIKGKRMSKKDKLRAANGS